VKSRYGEIENAIDNLDNLDLRSSGALGGVLEEEEEEEEEELVGIVHARGTIPNEMGPTHGC
jgi:hypothetical protein